MKYTATVSVMPQKEILDPQGKAVNLGLKNLGITEVSDVRVGKKITLALEAENEEAAKALVDMACKKLLANLIMEEYAFDLQSVSA